MYLLLFIIYLFHNIFHFIWRDVLQTQIII